MGRTIDELIESAQKKYNLNDQFVRRVLMHIDLGNVVHQSGNIWSVDGYECNQFTKTCTCPDNYPVDKNIGKMCPHVFAMTVMRLHEAENPKSRITLDDIMKLPGLMELRIDWDYEREDGKRYLLAYVCNRSVIRLKSDEKIAVDYEKLSYALRRYDYSLSDLPRKLEGSHEYIYQYPVKKGTGILFTESVWSTRVVTQAMVNSQVRKNWATQFAREVAN